MKRLQTRKGVVVAGAEQNPYLVVVGSSAGGIEALSELVSTIPESFSAPVVIAQHLDPERKSRLEEILSRRSTLPVRTVTEHEPLRPGVVYVVPADRHERLADAQAAEQHVAAAPLGARQHPGDEPATEQCTQPQRSLAARDAEGRADKSARSREVDQCAGEPVDRARDRQSRLAAILRARPR